jgi:sulfur carrier protein
MNAGATVQKTTALLVNGQAAHTSARTLAQWVQEQGQASESLATAVNGQFVQRDLRIQRVLADGDAIVTFQPIVGG